MLQILYEANRLFIESVVVFIYINHSSFINKQAKSIGIVKILNRVQLVKTKEDFHQLPTKIQMKENL